MFSSRPALSRQDRLPPLVLPVAWFAFAHLCLVVALAVLAADPGGFAGFFFHARAAAVVHLVTLGWVSSSILGALPIVGAVALRAPIPTRKADWIAFAGWCVGVSGVVSHFWLESFDGVAWAGLLVLASAATPLVRAGAALRRAPVSAAVRLHIVLAAANLFLAGGFGILLGFNKTRGFVPAFPLSATFAHAHLAAVGWVVMMVLGTGYRLLPMMIPAAMPDAAPAASPRRGGGGSARGLAASAILLQAGLLGLVAAFLSDSPLLPAAAGVCLAGFAAFAARIAWMLAHRRPPPAGAGRIDPPLLQMACAGIFLLATIGLGAWLAFQNARESEAALRVATLYGAFGLVGFLSQIVIGMQGRLVPLVAAIRETAAAGDSSILGDSTRDVPPPHARIDRRLQLAVLVLWAAGVPALAAGLYSGSAVLVGAGAWALLLSLPAHATGLAVASLHQSGRR